MRLIAKISSYVLHPLFLLLTNLFLIICLKPYWFGVNHWSEKSLLLILVGIYTIIIPSISILMLKFLNLIKSFEMQDKYDRIVPLIICMIFYLWLYINLKRDLSLPSIWIGFILTTVIATGLSIAINNWIKLSLHMVGMVSSTIFWVLIRFYYCEQETCYFKFDSLGNYTFQLNYFIMILTIFCGLIGTARLILKAHTNKELMIGIMVGIISTILANKFN